MYNVSTEYREQLNKVTRNPSFMRVRFGIIDADAESVSTISSVDGAIFSDTSQLTTDADLRILYGTFEPNRFLLDGRSEFLNSPYMYQGFVSDAISDIYGNFNGDSPSIVINASSPTDLKGVSMSFDRLYGDYPTLLTITATLSGSTVYTDTVANNSVEFILNEEIPLFDTLTITFLKTSLPVTRVRINYFTFGVNKLIDDEKLVSAKQTRYVDEMSTVLPKNDFTFTFLDVNREYDPDNPQGIYQEIEKVQPVRFEYGYELDDGSVEWVLGGSNLTNGTVNVNSGGKIPEVSFQTHSAIYSMDNEVRNGVYSTLNRTVYDLLDEILLASGNAYELSMDLMDYTTVTPLPVGSEKELIQILANYAQHTVNIGRDGKIIVTQPSKFVPLVDINDVTLTDPSNEVITGILRENESDINFTFDNMYDVPRLDKFPILRTITTTLYNFTEEASMTDLIKVEHSSVSPSTVYYKYPMATDVIISVDGTLIVSSESKYAEGCELVLSGSGTVTITGRKIIGTERKVRKQYNPIGEDLEINNPMLNDETYAYEYMDWLAEILMLRNKYTLENRGFPELDPLDTVGLDTLFNNNLQPTVLESIISYNGSIKGTTTVLV